MHKLESGEDQQIDTAEAHVAEPAQDTGARGVKLSVLLEANRQATEEYGPLDRLIGKDAFAIDRLRRSKVLTGAYSDLLGTSTAAAAAVSSILSMQSLYDEVVRANLGQWRSFAESIAEQQRQIRAARDMAAHRALLPWPTLYPEAPRRQIYAPEPEPTAEEQALEVVHLQGDWRAVLTTMIHDRHISPAELIQLALAHSERARPGQKLPPWEEIEAICLDYECNRRRYPNQEVFAHKHGISLATLKRYRKLWKAGRSM